MSKKVDEMLRKLWTSNIRFPMEPERSELTDEEEEFLERTQALPAPPEPPQAQVTDTDEEGVFIVNIPFSQMFRYLDAVNDQDEE